MTTYYTSNDPTAGFDATASGTLPAGWTSKAGTFAVNGTTLLNGHTQSLTSTSGADGDSVLLTGMTAVADMDVTYAMESLAGNDGAYMSPFLRTDTGFSNGYLFVINGHASGQHLTFLPFKRIGGGFSSIGSAVTNTATFNAGDTILVRARAQGSTISAKAWLKGTSEPAAWDISVTDSSVTAPGVAGFYYTSPGLANGAVDVVVTDIPSGETITVDTPPTVTAGASMTITGSYAGATPSALDFEFDSAGYVAVGSPAIAGGTFSFTATAPASGTHIVSVRDHTSTGVSGVSGSFATTASAALTVTTPAGLIVDGQALAIGGTYTGTAPTGLNVKVDSGAYVATTGFAASAGTWSASMTAPAFGSHTITVQETNSTATTASSAAFICAVAPDNANLLFSPYNWALSGGAARTINAGAYVSTLFSGAAATLHFDVSNMVSPASEIWWRVDGSAGPWTQAAIASSIAVTIPAATAGNADIPYHLLEVVVKSTTETQNRWNAGSGTAVILTGITLAPGAALATPLKAPLNLLVYGDSITEGVRTMGESAANDTDRNDAAAGWAFRLGALLGAEVGVVGFGATGLTVGGSGNVPALTSSYGLLSGGVARSFTPAPDLVVFHEGTNDGGASTIAAMTTVLNAVLAACPSAVIVVLRPFNGTAQASNLQAAIAACARPGACHYIDTTGIFDTGKGADTLDLHPAGPNNLGLIAPQLAAQIRPLLAGSAAPKFHAGFQRGLLG